jgi:uncharacterized protein (DUF433 family)
MLRSKRFTLTQVPNVPKFQLFQSSRSTRATKNQETSTNSAASRIAQDTDDRLQSQLLDLVPPPMPQYGEPFGERVMTVTDRIEVNPKVMLGKPVIRGTRVPVELILRKLSEGATEDDLLDAYPRLSRQDIQAAIGYAADTLAHEETLIVTPPKTRTHR